MGVETVYVWINILMQEPINCVLPVIISVKRVKEQVQIVWLVVIIEMLPHLVPVWQGFMMMVLHKIVNLVNIHVKHARILQHALLVMKPTLLELCLVYQIIAFAWVDIFNQLQILKFVPHAIQHVFNVLEATQIQLVQLVYPQRIVS